jgi:hypothetical protein
MPVDVVKRINSVINEEAQKPEAKTALLAIGQDAVIVTPDRFKGMIDQDIKRFSALGKESRIELD